IPPGRRGCFGHSGRRKNERGANRGGFHEGVWSRGGSLQFHSGERAPGESYGKDDLRGHIQNRESVGAAFSAKNENREGRAREAGGGYLPRRGRLRLLSHHQGRALHSFLGDR